MTTVTTVEVEAEDPKMGMTVQEIRAALANAANDATPVVAVNWRGRIRSIRVSTRYEVR